MKRQIFRILLTVVLLLVLIPCVVYAGAETMDDGQVECSGERSAVPRFLQDVQGRLDYFRHDNRHQLYSHRADRRHELHLHGALCK